MASTGIGASILRFGAFELDLRTNELRRSGLLLKLPPQQSKVLRYLAERTGQICTRDEIQREIWGEEVFVDFDRSLNVSIAQIRSVLNDDSEAPRFIQTVPRRGYRFVAPVEPVGGAQPLPVREPEPPRQNHAGTIIAAVVVLLGVAVAFYFFTGRTTGTRTMLAVLPFENLTKSADDAPILDGLADELITQFGAVEPNALGVIGRTSVMRYAARNSGVSQIARELGVKYVIEGGLRRGDGRIRISVRLIRADDQSQVWSESFEQDATDRLGIEEQIAARVTVAVAQQLFPQAGTASRGGHVPDAGAYEAFVKGRYLLYNGNRADYERAIAAFEDAGHRDAAFADPWAAIAHTYVGFVLSGARPAAAAFPKARDAAARALEINDANAEAHTALADVFFWNDWNWAEAKRHFERAIALNPSMAQVHHDYAIYQIVMGHAETGIAELRRAIAIDPLSPRVNVDAGWLFLQAHHFNEAIAQATRALDLEPGLAEAQACIERAKQYQGKSTPRMQAFFESRLKNPQTSAYNKALANAVLNHQEEALAQLESAYQQHEFLIPLIATEPSFKDLHSAPRFLAIVRRMGLAPR